MDRTFAMVKPDGVQRGLVGDILSRFEQRGLKVVGLKMLWIDEDLASRHYAEHVGKGFYQKLMEYITSGPVVAAVLEGKNAVQIARDMMGKTNPMEAGPGTIRGDYGLEIGRNVIHGSDSPASAEREIGLFFKPEELQDYEKIDAIWLYE
ncbi:MAG: nucleoside-diphosphate kinase [Thermoplasmata archaeon]|nr:nucleoside-diphosphate kinase [Thermoplasmata archaeon]